MRIDELHIAHTHENANNIYSESNTENTSYNVDITLKTKIDASSAVMLSHDTLQNNNSITTSWIRGSA